MPKDKISRICWNTEGWRKPSGKAGKSKNKDLYEYRFGYGHEEWLLDTTKLIDGWHYAYLQSIGLHRSKYIGEKFNISLYAINSKTKRRWWIGRILDVIVTTPEESQEVYANYRKRGWLKEMEEQLRNVNADVNDFRENTVPENFAVIRFRLKSLDILDTPMEFSKDDPAVSSNYYNLLNKKQSPKLLANKNQFEFTPGHKHKKDSTKSTYEEHSTKVDLVHNQIQTKIYRQLAKKYGEGNVGTEQDTGYGSQIDLVVKSDEGFIFYEIKTSYSVRLCIRKGLSQLLEYGYYPNTENAEKLIIVAPKKITKEAIRYMKSLRKNFDIPVYYQCYNPETESLEKVLY